MSAETSLLAGAAVAATTIVVLVSSLWLLVRLGRLGNLERAMAHTIVDAASRRAFLLGISTLAGTFVALGVATMLGNLTLLPDDVVDALTTSIFCSGAVALLFMVRAGFRVSRITLADELNLRDFEPDVYRALLAESARANGTSPSLYVLPGLEPPSGPSASVGPSRHR